MANPQKENGYTPISNEIMDEVAKLQINATQFRILIVVWRYTYGFSRKQHALSEGFISNATGIHKKRIGQELLDLIKRNVLTEEVAPSFASTRVISFNKNYQEWTNRDSQSIDRQSMKTLTGNERVDQTVNENVDRTVNENVDQDKQNIKQNIKQISIVDFFEKAWKLYPRKEGKGSVSKTQKKKLYDLGDEFIRCIERYVQKRTGEDSKYTQMGSTFFNSGYVDYLDKNYNQKTEPIVKRDPIQEKLETPGTIFIDIEKLMREGGIDGLDGLGKQERKNW